MGELIRVLIVDHDDSFRQATCALLEKADCAAATSEARNAQEAIESICQQQPDVVLLDVDTLCPNSPQTVAQIRELCPAGKIVMLSSRGQERLGCAHARCELRKRQAVYLSQVPVAAPRLSVAVIDLLDECVAFARERDQLTRSPAILRYEWKRFRIHDIGGESYFLPGIDRAAALHHEWRVRPDEDVLAAVIEIAPNSLGVLQISDRSSLNLIDEGGVDVRHDT